MSKLAFTAAAASLALWTLHGAAARAGQIGPLDNVGSSAFGIAATFVSEGDGTGLPPTPFTGGGIGWSPHAGYSLGSLNQTIGIAASGQQIATMQVTAGHLVVHAGAGHVTTRSVTPSADGSIDSVQITMQLYPPPGGPAPLPLLSVVLSGITWKASDSLTLPNAPVVSATANITSGKITGTLVNSDTLNIAGTQGPNNTVLIPLSSGSTRVTLNQQTTAGQISCASSCSFTPFGITVDALTIHFDHVPVGSHALSGDITVGNGEAHIQP